MDEYYLDQVLGENGKRSNRNKIYHCPSCHHRKHKLSINLDTHMFQCWVCGFKGRGLWKIFNLVNTPQLLRDKYVPINKQQKSQQDYLNDDDEFGRLMWNKLYGENYEDI